jgi:adhesin transport system outer membrane protein
MRNLGLAWVLVCAQPAAAAAESLTDELQGLLETHPEIQAKTKAVNSAEQGIGVARSAYLPTVKVNNSTGPEYDSTPTRWSTEGKPYERGGATSGFSVTEHLFDGFSTDSAVGAAKVNRDISATDLKSTRQSTVLEGASAYISVLQATRLIELARDNVHKVEDELNLEDERVEKGAGIASDVLAAKQRLQVAKEARVRFEGELQAAAAKYTQVFGHAPDTASMTEPPSLAGKLPASLEEALAGAEKDNPSVETAAKSIELTEQKRKGAEAGYYPTVDLVGHAGIDDGVSGIAGDSRTWSVLVVANWSIFDGWKTQKQVAQAASDHAASQDNHLYSIRKVQELVRTTWFKLSNDRERIGLLENAAVLAEDVWDATRKRHAAGKATVRDMLDDETRINDARIAYTQAYYDMVTATYEMLAATGRLEVGEVTSAPPGGIEEYNFPLDHSMTQPLGSGKEAAAQ